VQWYHRGNSSYVVIQPYSSSLTLDFTANLVGTDRFYATARAQGASVAQGTSNIVSVNILDSTPQCTAVKMIAPINNQTLHTGVAQPLTALATCPAGTVAEYQFWIKLTGAPAWTVLPGFTTGSGAWTPPSIGAWAIKAVARPVGAHVTYQVSSGSVSVNVIP
jgi:uncharacterized membrane protein